MNINFLEECPSLSPLLCFSPLKLQYDSSRKYLSFHKGNTNQIWFPGSKLMWNHFLYIIFIVFFSPFCIDFPSRLNNYSYIIWKGLLFCNIFSVSCCAFYGMQNTSIFNTFLRTQYVQFYLKQLEYMLWLPCIKLSFEACINVCLYALIRDLVNFRLKDSMFVNITFHLPCDISLIR